MRKLKIIVVALLLILLGALTLLFVLENQQDVSLALLGWSMPTMPVAVLVLGALAVGLAVGPFLAAYSLRRRYREIRAVARSEVSGRA